jgi:hypothetical protein
MGNAIEIYTVRILIALHYQRLKSNYENGTFDKIFRGRIEDEGKINFPIKV